MVAASTQNQLSGLGRAMVQKGLLPEREAQALQDKANEAGLELRRAPGRGEAVQRNRGRRVRGPHLRLPAGRSERLRPRSPAREADRRQSAPVAARAAAVPARQSRVRGDLGSDQPGRDGPDQVPDRPARRTGGGRGRQARNPDRQADPGERRDLEGHGHRRDGRRADRGGRRSSRPSSSRSRSTTHRSSSTCRRSCSTPSTAAPRTSTSSPTRRSTASATAWTASSTRWPPRRSPSRRRSPRASR